MKSFDEQLVSGIDVLTSPITWAMAMHEKTGAAIVDLEDYAVRRLLWHGIAQSESGSLEAAVKYLLGMDHLK